MKIKNPTYWELVDALADLLSTEDCVCLEAELEEGQCSVCLYNKMLDRIDWKARPKEPIARVA